MTASPTPFFAESAGETDHAPDARNMVSAATPSEEDLTERIIAFLKLRDEMVTDPDERTDDERDESAKELATLFAPILAEKERLEDELEGTDWHAVEAARQRDVWKSRALAAEAALAAERALLARAKDHIVQYADDLSMHSPAAKLVEEIVAAIRAQDGSNVA